MVPFWAVLSGAGGLIPALFRAESWRCLLAVSAAQFIVVEVAVPVDRESLDDVWRRVGGRGGYEWEGGA